MKSELFNISEIQRMLVIPRPTIVKRINRFGFKPVEKIKCRSRTRFFYSKEQLEVLKEYFQSDSYKPEPKPFLSLIVRYEIDENKNCTIVIQSKLNYLNENQL